jgi:hypothetical protein
LAICNAVLWQMGIGCVVVKVGACVVMMMVVVEGAKGKSEDEG